MSYIVHVCIHVVVYLFCYYDHFSGMFPLFKPGTSNLGGGYIRAHITAKPQFGRNDQVSASIILILLFSKAIRLHVLFSRLMFSIDAQLFNVKFTYPGKAVRWTDC